MVSSAGREVLVTVPSLSILVVESGQLLNRENFLIAKAGESRAQVLQGMRIKSTATEIK